MSHSQLESTILHESIIFKNIYSKGIAIYQCDNKQSSIFFVKCFRILFQSIQMHQALIFSMYHIKYLFSIIYQWSIVYFL